MDWLNYEYIWALLAVPAAILLFLWAGWKRKQAAEAFGDSRLVTRLSKAISARRRRWKAAFIVLGVLFVGVALMGPRFGTKLREVKREGIDLIVALDVSLSMMAEDVRPNRLERSKNEIKKMLNDLQGDRVGLVIFAGDAFVQCPLTTDYSAVRLFLDVANPEMIPTPGTDFGAAFTMAKQAFRGASEEEASSEDEQRTRALLFVSDGENHVSNISQLIGEAEDEGIVIFSAGVGETEGVPIPIYRNGRRIDFKKDRNGRIVSTRLEEQSLQDLGSEGGYFRIANTSSSLPKIFEALGRLEKTEFGAEEFEEYEEQYQWPLALGLFFLFCERLVSDRRNRSNLDDDDTTLNTSS